MKHSRKLPKEARGYGSPFLTGVSIKTDRVGSGYPFDIPVVQAGLDLTFTTPVTFFVGENGTGKSTLLEALAWAAGFSSQGGSRDHQFGENDDGRLLGRALTLKWRQRVVDGFFLRAETFFNLATYLENSGSTFERYGGQPLHEQSHGESFLALFNNRFEDGLYILDEPEAALSPQRQLAFLGILHSLATARIAQFLIASHSPMLLALPGATVLSLDSGRIETIDYRDTAHFQLMKDFLESPERFFRHLFEEDPDRS